MRACIRAYVQAYEWCQQSVHREEEPAHHVDGLPPVRVRGVLVMKYLDGAREGGWLAVPYGAPRRKCEAEEQQWNAYRPHDAVGDREGFDAIVLGGVALDGHVGCQKEGVGVGLIVRSEGKAQPRREDGARDGRHLHVYVRTCVRTGTCAHVTRGMVRERFGTCMRTCMCMYMCACDARTVRGAVSTAMNSSTSVSGAPASRSVVQERNRRQQRRSRRLATVTAAA